MKRHSAVAIGLALSLTVAVLAADTATVKDLIRRLGSDSFEEREKATKLLLEREEALPELRKAAESGDPEVRRRASDLIESIEERQAKRGFAKAALLAQSGKVDQAIERLVRWGERDREGVSLEALSDLAVKLLEREKRQFGKVRIEGRSKDYPNPLQGFAAFKKAGGYRTVHSRFPLVLEEKMPGEKKMGSFLAWGPDVTAKVRWGTVNSLIASSGNIAVSGDALGLSLLFACGSVTLDNREGTQRLVIVCDGDVTFRDGRGPRSLSGCLIIAGGDVILPKDVCDSAIFAGGSVKQPKARAGSLSNSVVREHETNALGLVRFFDPSEAGIEVAAGKDGAKVKAAPKGKPFAEAGLRPGDLVTAVNGMKTPSPQEFRNRLRAALADGGPTIPLTVQRDGKTLTVAIAVKD